MCPATCGGGFFRLFPCQINNTRSADQLSRPDVLYGGVGAARLITPQGRRFKFKNSAPSAYLSVQNLSLKRHFYSQKSRECFAFRAFSGRPSSLSEENAGIGRSSDELKRADNILVISISISGASVKVTDAFLASHGHDLQHRILSAHNPAHELAGLTTILL